MALQNCSIWSMKTFLSGTYHIPNYQREYAWEDNELEDFWNDLRYTKDDPDKMSHFFGQIVIHHEDDSKYIIDGQQRTVTSVIFLRALQIYYADIYKATGNRDADAQQSEISSLIGRCTSKKGNRLHLILNEQDEEYFREGIQLGNPNPDTKEKKESRERMRQAFCFFHRKLGDALADDAGNDVDDQIECLDAYYETFTERFEVLYMEATKLEEAFVIFETLNARGRDLETADLLKNYIFRQSKDVSESQKRWNSMIGALGKADPTKYIRHFWNSNHEFERDKTLYRAISKNVKTPKSSKDLLKELERCAPYYHSMAFPEEDILFQNPNLIRSLKALKVLKARSFYPLILAMEQSSFSEEDIAAVAAEIEIYTLRNITICGKVANESERFFALTARNIYDGELDTAADICERIREKMVPDDEFKAAFVNWSAAKSEKEIVRYILSRVHCHLDRNMELNLDTSVVHVEHIMPVDASQWEIDPEVHEHYLWRLGNLMLLSGPLNISASNRPFEEKKARYLESKIEPNRDVCKYDAWGSDEIVERQTALMNYAVVIWRK